MRIACVGGGPAGLYFAIAMKLRAPDHDITVYERGAVGATEGWGVAFAPSLLGKLRENDPVSAREIERSALGWHRQYVDIRGVRVPYESGMEIYNLNRPHLVEILAGRARDLGVRVEYSHEVETAARVRDDADLIVAADGAGSRLRRENASFGTTVRVNRDKYIWLGTDKRFDAFAYHFTRTDSGWVWASSYGVGSGLSTFVVHCSSQTWDGLAFGSMSAEDCLAVLSDIFSDQLDGHRLLGRVGSETDIRWLSTRNVTNRRWHDGKVVLLGDAAHTPHFSAGLGTTLAVEGAIALADSLCRHDDIELALRGYEQQCRAGMRKSWAQAACSGRWFENITRYVDLEPHQFATLVHARRSPLVPLLPPKFYYVLRQSQRRITPAVKTVYRRRREASQGRLA
jgi:2-polyprenyl-6-methoxyphenol hydroxylase-like FAD-dependent oxidoreductase